jgi:hypothetical protein
MQDATIIEAYTELEAGLDAFVEAVSDLLTADRMAHESESGTLGGLASLSRAKWLRLRALEGEHLRAWIGSEVELAHATIIGACERIGCVIPDDQPEPIRKTVALAARVADNLLAVASRADLRRMTPALLDTLDALCDALPDLEPPAEPLPSWSKDELIRETGVFDGSAISDRTMVRILGAAKIKGRKKGKRYGPSEVGSLIAAAAQGAPTDAERCARAWRALLQRTD